MALNPHFNRAKTDTLDRLYTEFDEMTIERCAAKELIPLVKDSTTFEELEPLKLQIAICSIKENPCAPTKSTDTATHVSTTNQSLSEPREVL